MAREDKIVIIFILCTILGASYGLMRVVKYIGSSVFNLFEVSGQGVGYSTAFLISLCISFLLISFFAVISGGGELLGELPFVIFGFLVFVLFFTISICIIF